MHFSSSSWKPGSSVNKDTELIEISSNSSSSDKSNNNYDKECLLFHKFSFEELESYFLVTIEELSGYIEETIWLSLKQCLVMC